MIADVQVLAGEIGPRGTGTAGEKAAAEFVTERIRALGLPVDRQSFHAVSSQNAFPRAICVVLLAAFVLYPLDGAAGRWIATLMALSATPLLWQTLRFSTNLLRPFLVRVTSQNVTTRIEPRGTIRGRAVLLAHLDTNRCRLVWQSSGLRFLEPLTWLTLVMLALPGLLYLIGAALAPFAGDGVGWPWLASLLPAAFVAGMLVTLHKDDRTPLSCGAHDNAASVAVALEIARRLAASPLESTEVWLAFTGAEETDHAGLYALLRRHGDVLRDAAFVGLEGLGSGDLVYLTSQGLCAHYRPDPTLLALAVKAAARLPEICARPARITGEDETGTLRRMGYKAICIAGRDPTTGTLPHWHRADDTADTVSVGFMEDAAEFLTGILHELDEIERVAGNVEPPVPS